MYNFAGLVTSTDLPKVDSRLFEHQKLCLMRVIWETYEDRFTPTRFGQAAETVFTIPAILIEITSSLQVSIQSRLTLFLAGGQNYDNLKGRFCPPENSRTTRWISRHWTRRDVIFLNMPKMDSDQQGV